MIALTLSLEQGATNKQIANVNYQISNLKISTLQSKILNLKSEIGLVGFHDIGFDDSCDVSPVDFYPYLL